MGYSNNVSSYEPQLKKGVWYTKADKGEYLPVVITEMVSGYDVGDVLELKSGSDSESQKFIICGILQNGASFYNIGTSKKNINVFDFYTPYDPTYDDTLEHMMFFSMEKAEKMGYECFKSGRIIIKYVVLCQDLVQNKMRGSAS